MKDNLATLSFSDQASFVKWLEKHHDHEPGLWLRVYKKNSGVKSIIREEAVEAALCFGWIDSLVHRLDEKSYLQKFTPRRPRSIWSKKNCATAERLITEGRMQPAGLRQVEAAKADGRWARAYSSSSKAHHQSRSSS